MVALRSKLPEQVIGNFLMKNNHSNVNFQMLSKDDSDVGDKVMLMTKFYNV